MRLLLLAIDSFILFVSFPLSLILRYGTHEGLVERFPSFYIVCAIIFGVKLLFYFISKFSKSIWKFFGAFEILELIKFVGGSLLVSFTILFLYNRMAAVPRSSLIIDFFITISSLAGIRLLSRVFTEQNEKFKQKENCLNVIVIGAEKSGRELARALKRNSENRYKIAGFLDENKKNHKKFIEGTRVYGGIDKLGNLLERFNIDYVFLSVDKSSSKLMREATIICSKYNIALKKLPSMEEIANGNVQVSNLKALKLEDLLGRKEICLEKKLISNMVEGKTVLITGGGGSIGSELCRQICEFKPQKIIIFEICEFFIYQIENELKEKYPEVEIVPVIGNIRDRNRLVSCFEKYKPNFVLHAAAYKHVPLMEHNPTEALKTNILGTHNVASVALEFDCDKFVMISSDKAVNPTNIMGATKRVAEMICNNFQDQGKTQFGIVRFGNVLGSNGSVIPYFLNQISKGGPVTVTHPEITRFFMTIPEASQLVLQAAAMSKGGEIFVLEMGESVKIVDLAKDLIRLSGHDVDDIGIKFIGLRPGEKLYEELLANDEDTIKTFHPQVRVAKNRDISPELESSVTGMFESMIDLDHEKLIKTLVPEYHKENHLT